MIDTENSKKYRTAKKNSEARRSKTSINERPKLHGPTNVTDGSTFSDEAKEIANVVYVSPKHARQTKNFLQQKGWLEKRYRMIKIDRKNEQNGDESRSSSSLPKHMVAVPISVPFIEATAVLSEFILHHGEAELPLSTSQYASKTK